MRWVVLFLSLLALAYGLKQDWVFADETRRQFLIERFAFEADGQLEAELHVAPTSQLARTSILFVHVRRSPPRRHRPLMQWVV